MDLDDTRQREELRHHLAGLLRGRKVICGIGPLAGYTGTVELLREVGALRPLLIASGAGAGPIPDPGAAEVVFLDVPASPSITEDLRRLDHLVRHLPPSVADAVEGYDVDREAVWLAGPFVDTAPVLGRAVVGGRPRAWAALEDKLVGDEIWDAVGAARPPSR